VYKKLELLPAVLLPVELLSELSLMIVS